MPTATKENYSAWDIPRHTPEKFGTLTPREQPEYLCLVANLAPSSHNTQPWVFSIDQNNIITMSIERNMILPASDVAGRQTCISMGCSLEHLTIAATYLGIKLDITLRPMQKTDVLPNTSADHSYLPFADITTSKQEPNEQYAQLFNALFTRKVIRAEFDPQRTMAEATLAELNTIADSHGMKLHTITDHVRRCMLAEFQGQADGYVINSKKFSRELGDWLLPNNTDNYRGMPGGGFGLQDAQAKRLHEGLTGTGTLEPEDGLRFALAGKIGMEKSPLICFLTSENDEIVDWVRAGQCFDHLFVFLESQGISVAVHAGIVEVTLVNKMFSISVGTRRKILAVFRVGYPKNEADQHRPHSPRRTKESLFI